MVALGGVICHLLLIPPWVFCTVLPCVATAMLLQRAQLAVLVAQVVLSTLAYQKPKTGVPVALVSSAISYAMYLGGDRLVDAATTTWITLRASTRPKDRAGREP